MPIVSVEMFEGRTYEQKRKLVRDVTDAVTANIGVPASAVYVTLKEYSRENWGRDGLLNLDRATSAFTDRLSEESDSEDLFVVAEGVPLDLAGHAGTTLARRREDGLLVSLQSTRSEGGLKEILKALHDAGATATTSCVRVDLPNGGGLDGAVRLPRYLSMSTHTVRPEVVEQYLELRRVAVHPDMARLSGFVSSNLLRKVDQPNAFFVVNQWLDKEHADRYGDGPVHAWLKSRVRPLLDDHSGMRDFDVLPVA